MTTQEFTSNVLLDECIAEIEIRYSQRIQLKDRLIITDEEKAANVLRSTWNDNTIELRESFKVMLFNNRMQLLGIATVAEGGINLLHIDIRLIFAIALKSLATRIIVAHNHPTGGTVPSHADILLSKQLEKAGRILDIIVVDQLIITKDGYAPIFRKDPNIIGASSNSFNYKN